MKNIIIVLMLLLASQILVAYAQDVSPELNGPNDCGALRKPIIARIFSLPKSEEDSKCGAIVEPEKPKMIESKDRGSNPKICNFAGACGEVDYNKKNSQIIILK